MKRREFSIRALAGASLTLSPALARLAPAHAAPVNGTNYLTLAQRVPVSAPAGKVEVLEFFWYGCPHCYQFEPFVNEWARKLPPHVAFRRVPVVFRPNPFVAHQRLFYAIEALDQPQLHEKVFHAMHVQQQRLDSPDEIAAFAARNGVDKAAFLKAYNSFSVQTKASQARSLMEAYKVDGVPAIGVAGRFYTTISLNGSPQNTLATVDYLIEQARKTR